MLLRQMSKCAKNTGCGSHDQELARPRSYVSLGPVIGVVLSLATPFLPSPAAAQYPERAVKIVVTYPAGGATDVLSRVIGQRLSERIKQPVVVENRPGASGMIGSDAVAKAQPDGYTIIHAVVDTHSINPHVYSKIAYDAERDFTPIAMIGFTPYAFIINPSVPAKTLSEFVTLAKERGNLTFASWGVGSSAHIAGEMFKAAANVNMRHIPYQGAAPALTAVMGGEVSALTLPLTVAEPNHRSGKVRILAVATPERMKVASDLPTFKELGLELTITAWHGYMGPANMPAEVVALLNREINAVLNDPSTQETLLKSGLVAQTSNPEEFKAFLEREYKHWGKPVRDANIKAD